jgi:2-amino-4-hydroxy-6-hydroxymethyldihydropteridine diphosphokinase
VSRRLAQGLPPVDAASERPPVTAVVALGSNLGDRGRILESAVREIARLPLVDAVTLSPVIESVAVTVDGPDENAPAYLNAVALVTTRLAPSVLLGMLHGIETAAGRERRVRWGDRTLDLDLIAYGDVVSDGPALVLPHPRAAERDFVLGPWLEADPEAVLIGRGRVADLLAALRADGSRSGGRGDAAGAST